MCRKQSIGEKWQLILTIILIQYFPSSNAWWPREYPRIGLNRWLELEQENLVGEGRWRHDFENISKNYMSILDQGVTYVVSSQITGLGFECNATYPIQWVARLQDKGDYHSFYTRVHYFRSNPDVFNPRSNTFMAQLDMYGEQSAISGNYSCVSTQFPYDVVKSIYVYWQGTNPSNLILGGKTVDAQTTDGHYLILPCRVSKPGVVVNLYKEDWVSVKSPYIKFNPKYGFRINLYQYNGAVGRFKCAVGDDEDEDLIINVKKGVKDEELEFNNTMDQKASLYYNKTTQEIVCCSTSSKAPKLHTLFCVDNFSCEVRRSLLYSILNNGRRNKDKSCTSERIYIKDSGLFRCMGDGIDLVKNFYTDLPTKKNNHTANLYFNWNDVIPQNMVEISTVSRGAIYEKQNITVTCDTGFNYFADGMQWAIRWKNHSLKFFPPPAPKVSPGVLDMYESNIASYQSLKLQARHDIMEILCFIPVWNDTTWINKSLTIDVHETKRPILAHPEVEVFQWALNSTEKMIDCRVTGAPSPSIRWKKNNKTILHDNNLMFKRINGTSFLVIHRVSHDVHGEYRCIASNFGGTVEKRFMIYVEGPTSTLGVVGFTLLILMIVILISGVGFLVWKMQLQRKLIDHLAGIVFRDVNTTTSENNAQQSNNNQVVSINRIVGSTRCNSDQNPFPDCVS